MSSIGPMLNLVPGDIRLDLAATDPSLAQIGAMSVTADGRTFRMCKAGGTDLVRGKLQQAPAEVTNHQDLSPTAAVAVGGTEVTVTLGDTDASADQYAGGYMIVTGTAGTGHIYEIESHPAASGTETLTLQLADEVQVALTNSSTVDLVSNPYKGVIVCPTSLTSAPVGVAITDITADQVGWIQVGGAASCLAENNLTVGLHVVASDDTAGAVETITDGDHELLPPVGRALTGVGDGEYGAVLLSLH